LAGVAGVILVILIATILLALLGGDKPSTEKLSSPPASSLSSGPTATLKPKESEAKATDLPPTDLAVPILYKVQEGDTESLYATDLQGSGPYLLASGADAVSTRISPDGARVTVSLKRDDLYTVYLMKPDGSDRQMLTSDRTFAAAYFSEDGQKVRVYARDAVDNQDSGVSSYKYDLMVMESDGSNPVMLVNQADYASSSWTADGQLLALSTKRGETYSLHVVGSDGSGQKTIATGQDSSYNARLSSEGRWLYYQTYDGEIRRLFLSNPDGSQAVELFSGFYRAWPYLSSSGDKLLVSLVPSQGAPEELHIVDTESGQSLRLAAEENIADVSFSPDEKWIAAEIKRAGLYHIHLFSADGTQRKEIVGPGEGADWYASVDFSPDGERLLIRLGYRQDEATDLYVMNTDGGQRVELVHQASWPVSAAFTADGESVVFGSNRDGGRRIFVADTDGSQLRELAEGFAPVVASGRPPVMYSPRPLPPPTATPAPTAQTEPSND
jgi:Tol biopolymer transport system component